MQCILYPVQVIEKKTLKMNFDRCVRNRCRKKTFTRAKIYIINHSLAPKLRNKDIKFVNVIKD